MRWQWAWAASVVEGQGDGRAALSQLGGELLLCFTQRLRARVLPVSQAAWMATRSVFLTYTQGSMVGSVIADVLLLLAVLLGSTALALLLAPKPRLRRAPGAAPVAVTALVVER